MKDLSEVSFAMAGKSGAFIEWLTDRVNHLDPQRFEERILESNVRVLMALTRDTLSGYYTDLSLLAFARVILALDYFVRVDDGTPDTQAGGYEDDMQEVLKVCQDFKEELQRYQAWQQRQQP